MMDGRETWNYGKGVDARRGQRAAHYYLIIGASTVDDNQPSHFPSTFWRETQFYSATKQSEEEYSHGHVL